MNFALARKTDACLSGRPHTGMRLIVARVGLAVSMALIAVMVSAGSVSASPFAFGKSSFCVPKKPVEDFGLSKLPPVREVPESAKGLGYGAVTIYRGQSQVMPRPLPIGFGFSERNYTGGGVLLNWTVTAQLWAVDRRGRAFREVGADKLFIGRLDVADQPSIEVDPLKGRRGFYRFDMQIMNQAGEVLGSYSTYFKIARPTWRPKLRLSQDVVQPGQQLLIRLENHGSETVSFRRSFWVSRFEDGRWTHVRDLSHPRSILRRLHLSPGGTGGCAVLSLPADTPPSLYRVTRRVGTDRYPDGKGEFLDAPFEVIGPGATIEY